MTQFQVGDLIENRYRILHVIETGGMGTLYRVVDEAKDDEIIALKTVRLSDSVADKLASVELFQREFQLLTELRHPNLVSVYDFGITTGGEIYFTMEWVEGQELEPGKPKLEPEATIPVIVQICRALAYLHARGVIHGDLKPANVLMVDDASDVGQRAKILDFGVALETRSVEARARYYSLGYSAPEMREKRAVDHRSDLYGLGAMWYALLLGEPPTFMFGAESMIPFALNEALDPQDQVSMALKGVIIRLLATTPEGRYTSANEVIEAVNEVTGSTYGLETRETASSYALRTRFVNRETEMEVLQTMWEQAKSGSGKLVLISGESGLGKTRLVEELEIRAELEGARVVWGQCVESGGSAYKPWREVLRVLIRYVEGARLSQKVELDIKRVGPVLAAMLPELWDRDYMAGLTPPAELAPQAAQQRLHSAIVHILIAAAKLRPTVIVMENAQWADQATLAMLSFLTRMIEQMGLLVCVTYRINEVSINNPLVRMAGDHVLRIPIQALSPQVTSELVRSMLGLEELPVLLADQLQRTTGGNAFFVQELIRSLAAEGKVLRRTVDGWWVDQELLRKVQLPESIHQVIGRRLTQLSTDAHQMLGWASVMGIVCWEGGLSEVGGVPRSQIRETLLELLDLKLLVVRDESAFAGEPEYLFLNPTVRKVRYESIAGGERQKIHKRVVAWLMAREDEVIDEHLGLLADHLEKAGQTEQALVYLHRAGEQALAQFANEQAVDYLNRAMALVSEEQLTTRYNLLLSREAIYHLQGARDAQAEDLDALEHLAQVRQRPEEQAEVALRRAKVALVTGDYPAVIASVQVGIAQAQAAEDLEREAEAQLRWGEALSRQDEYDAGYERLKSALVLAQTSGRRDLEVEILLDIGNVAMTLVGYTEGRNYSEQALAIAHEIGHRQFEGMALLSLGSAVSVLGDHTKAWDYYEKALMIAREIGHRQDENSALLELGLVTRFLGDHASSRDYFERVLDVSREIGDRRIESISLLNLGVITRSLGDYAGAQDYFERVLVIFRKMGDRSRASLTLHDLGIVADLQGDYARAQSYNEQSLALAREVSNRMGVGYALNALARSLVGLEELAKAVAIYQQAVDERRESGDVSLVIESLAGLAHATLLQGDLAAAQLHVEEILSYLENNMLDGTEDPLRIYLICYHVLRANQDHRTQDVLTTAHTLLQEHAAKISDEEMRRSFLENVAVHREIVDEWTNRQNNA
ncbi:MAG: tetratricopeptide repeat protein [Chloroflexi bacterium]|nr:tetratricopeptide repeat protein [Chloroflexota bacterium]